MPARRNFILALAAGALAGPQRAVSQPSRKLWRLGFLAPAEVSSKSGEVSPFGMAFLNSMQAEGHVLGTDFNIEARSAEGDYRRLPALAAEMVRSKVDILIPISPVAVHAAHKASTTIPIVCIGAHDPVGMKMAASPARPGGNLTGLASFYGALIPKHFELLRSLLPKASRVAILVNVGAEADPAGIGVILEAAQRLGLHLQQVRGVTPEEFTLAFADMKRERAEAMVAVADAAVVREARLIADLAIRQRLPTVFASRENVQAGGLMSYGENFIELFSKAAKYVSKIMKGARPGDLAIEQPSKFNLVLNLGTAKVLKLAIPQEIRLRADELID